MAIMAYYKNSKWYVFLMHNHNFVKNNVIKKIRQFNDAMKKRTRFHGKNCQNARLFVEK